MPTATHTAFITGLTLSASLIVAIGAQNTFVLRQGLRREHVAAVVGLCTLLDVVLMAMGVGGLGAALGGQPGLLRAVGLAGAVVLAAYGVAAFRRALAPQRLHTQAAGAAQPARRVLLQALGISLLNPHVYLDTVLLVGSVGAQQAAGTRGAFLAGAGLASGLWFAALGVGARGLGRWFERPQAWRLLDVVVGLSMLWIAAQLAQGSLAP